MPSHACNPSSGTMGSGIPLSRKRTERISLPSTKRRKVETCRYDGDKSETPVQDKEEQKNRETEFSPLLTAVRKMCTSHRPLPGNDTRGNELSNLVSSMKSWALVDLQEWRKEQENKEGKKNMKARQAAARREMLRLQTSATK